MCSLIKRGATNTLTLSFSNLNLQKCIIVSNNKSWIDRYAGSNLYKLDPLCNWEDKNYQDIIRNNNINKTRFSDIQAAHNDINGKMLRNIRREHGIHAGGVSISCFDDLVLSVGWWSSNKNINFRKEMSCPNNRLFFENILKEVFFIYFQNKKILFS